MSIIEKYTTFLQEEQFTRWLLPQKPWVTLAIFAANVLVYVAMCIATGGDALVSPTSPELLNWGALYSPLTLTGQPWRLLTAAFLHIGTVHIATNMIGLWYFGKICERLYGPFRYLVIYLLAAVGGSLFSTLYSILITPIAGAGASGAICGIFGAYFWFVLSHKPDFDEQIYARMIWQFGVSAIFSVVYGLFAHADHAAHFGGAFVGVLTGAALMPGTDSRKSLLPVQLFGVTAVVAGLGALFWLAESGIADVRGDVQLYQARMLEASNQPEKEKECLLNVIKAHPNSSEAYTHMAICDIRRNDTQDALDAAGKALKISITAPVKVSC
jgi:rhomboid protease GluP